jgi:hypothetical protein
VGLYVLLKALLVHVGYGGWVEETKRNSDALTVSPTVAMRQVAADPAEAKATDWNKAPLRQSILEESSHTTSFENRDHHFSYFCHQANQPYVLY